MLVDEHLVPDDGPFTGANVLAARGVTVPPSRIAGPIASLYCAASTTSALKAGPSPKVVSERIGHADAGFFLQTYAHVLKNDDRDAAEQAASFLLGASWDSDDEQR